MAGDGSMPYQSQDEIIGQQLARLMNPPDDPKQAPVAAAVPDQRFAVPPGQPPNPVLQVRGGTQPSPSPAVPPRPSMPSAVTPSGNGGSTSSPFRSIAQQSAQGSLDTATQARDLYGNAVPPPDTTQLDTQIESLSSPTQMGPQYKPGIGTRIIRGIGAAGRGSLPGVFDPSSVGATPYGAPNSAYTRAEARRTQNLTADQLQKTDMLARWKAANDASEARAKGLISTQPGFRDAGDTATTQEKADSTAAQDAATVAHNTATEQQAAVPKNFEEAVILSKTDPDPVKRQQYANAADQIAKQDVKKFQYAARATGGGDEDPRRQPMIDAATAEIDKLNSYEFDPDANGGAGGFYDPATPTKTYSPVEFTAMKNQIATKLDKDLTTKKMRPLGVRFNVAATTPGRTPVAPAPAPTAAPAQVAPTPPRLPKSQMIEGRSGTDAQGNKWKVVKGQMTLVQRAGGGQGTPNPQ